MTSDGTTSYSYDDAGNLTEAGSNTFEWGRQERVAQRRIARRALSAGERVLSAMRVRYRVMTWSGGLPDRAAYRSGKHPTCTPATVPLTRQSPGTPSARPRSRAH
jgi:YD repeat-containing protein